MFKLFFRKEYSLEKLIYAYLDTFELTRECYVKAFAACLDNPLGSDIDFLIERTHKHESKADDIREEIKSLMYGKALIPDSRGDVMGLLETVDGIPQIFEKVLYMMQTQRLYVPEFLKMDVGDLHRLSLECCRLLKRQMEALFQKKPGIRKLLAEIDTHESHSDRIERRIIASIFDSEIDPFLKLQLKELTITIGDISDKAEEVARRINIISMKRRV